MPLDNKLVDTTSEVGETEPLCDGKMIYSVVDVRFSEEILTQADDRADAKVLGDLPDTANRVARHLQLARVDKPQYGEDGDRRVLHKVYRDDLACRELGKLLNEVIAVCGQHYLDAIHAERMPPILLRNVLHNKPLRLSVRPTCAMDSVKTDYYLNIF